LDVEAFMRRSRQRGDAPTPATMSKDRSMLITFYKWLGHRKLVSDNPAYFAATPKVRNTQPKAIPDDVWVHFWSSIRVPEDRVWVGLGAFAGLRRMEICAVGPHNFSLDDQKINRLVRKGGGTHPVEYGDMARVVAHKLPHLLPDVDQWITDVSELVEAREGEHVLVTWDLPATIRQREMYALSHEHVPSPDTLYKNLARLIKQADLPAGSFSPHWLRHTCATNLARCGVPLELIASQLSHSSVNTTMRYVNNSNRLGQWHNQNKGR
jgi:integrase